MREKKKNVLTFWRVFPRPVIYLVLLWEDRQSHQQRKKNGNIENKTTIALLFYFISATLTISSKIQIWVRYSNALSDPCVVLILAIFKPR